MPEKEERKRRTHCSPRQTKPSFLFSPFLSFYLRRSRQVLELCKLLLLLLLLGWLLLWGGSSLSEHSSIVVYFGFINSLRGGIRLLNQFPFTWLWFYEFTGIQHSWSSWCSIFDMLKWSPDLLMTFVTNISYPPQVFEQSLFLFSSDPTNWGFPFL